LTGASYIGIEFSGTNLTTDTISLMKEKNSTREKKMQVYVGKEVL